MEPAVQAIIFIYIVLALIAVVTLVIGRGKTADFKKLLWGIVLLIPFGTVLFFTYVYPYNFLYVLEHPHGFTLMTKVFPLLCVIGFIIIVMSFIKDITEMVNKFIKKNN